MNELEKQLHYPFGDALPAPGAAMLVAPGVKWIRMSLPFALNHINLWLLRDELDGVQGWSVVDCCISNDAARAQWEQIFNQELDGLPILRVIVTHMHPDHVGLAHWLCERWQAPLWISATDYCMARIGTLGPTGFGGESAAAFFARHGLNDPDAMEQVAARSTYFPSLVPSMPNQYRRMQDGDTLSVGGHHWQCISGYGHAPEHISLHCAELGLLIGGDMMLPRISTNVSVYDQEPEANPLRQFLDSIDRFRSLDAQTLTLPSHGKPFTGLYRRIDQLHAHHAERLAEVLAACDERPCSAAEVLPVLFKRALDLHQTTFAMGESIAHLHLLWHDGRLQRRVSDDGIYRFSSRTATAAAGPADQAHAT
ncbi:MAG: MBL fold metallo-hydrolase [Betaproteobacteria bacterium]|nr:MBL fold metallo-hydrolase [Betaproteobacteria bacterium]